MRACRIWYSSRWIRSARRSSSSAPSRHVPAVSSAREYASERRRSGRLGITSPPSLVRGLADAALGAMRLLPPMLLAVVAAAMASAMLAAGERDEVRGIHAPAVLAGVVQRRPRLPSDECVERTVGRAAPVAGIAVAIMVAQPAPAGVGQADLDLVEPDSDHASFDSFTSLMNADMF